ncbi:MAG: ATP-binding protein [Solirubrobacteraceae bacterium]
MSLRRVRHRPDGERSTPRPPLSRSIRTRLAVTFFLVTALSVAVIYVVVAPPLTSGLQNERVADLEKIVTNAKNKRLINLLGQLKAVHLVNPATTYETRLVAQLAQELANITVSQVTVVNVLAQLPPIASGPQADEIAARPTRQENYAIDAFAAFVPIYSSPFDSVRHGFLPGSLAAVGLGLKTQNTLSMVVVFSVPLNDVGGAVALVRSRILLAAAIGLLVALITGALVARALTVRVLRLEQTAQRVAQGDFGAHFGDSSGDELGQLARALAHMQSQLEGLDSARRRFIATASHELRTPIFSLGGFLELIDDEALDEETRRQFVGQVRDQVDRLGKLATQLLDLTRLESGAVELSATPTDLGVLVRAVTAEFGPALSQHGSQMVLRIPAKPVRVTCDGERVGQLLRILIDNALAHTPSGTNVVVSAERDESGGGASLAVSDSGPGIPEEAISRVFEPFYSADGARGAGLGLAIARELAAHMNAALEIASVPGRTTFTLTLPPGEA